MDEGGSVDMTFSFEAYIPLSFFAIEKISTLSFSILFRDVWAWAWHGASFGLHVDYKSEIYQVINDYLNQQTILLFKSYIQHPTMLPIQ